MASPVGDLPLGPGITAVLDRAAELIGGTPEFDLLAAAYTPDATFASAFARLIAATFADYGLVVIDASTRAFHALGAPVLRQAIEARSRLRICSPQPRQAPRRTRLPLPGPGRPRQQPALPSRRNHRRPHPPAPQERKLVRRQGAQYSTADLLAILDTTPERLSPNALLRPVFQDFLLPTQAAIGGPAEIAYFAQSQVLYQAILGRTTPVLPRLSATLIEPSIAKVLEQHELSLSDILTSHPDELAHRLGARSMPVEGKRRLAATGNVLDDELDALIAWTDSLDPALGRSARVSASKMRYQMNRLRRLAANVPAPARRQHPPPRRHALLQPFPRPPSPGAHHRRHRLPRPLRRTAPLDPRRAGHPGLPRPQSHLPLIH